MSYSSRLRVRSCSAAIALCAGLPLGAVFAASAHAQTYKYEQATTLGAGFGMFEPSLSANGRLVAFRTSANFTGQNADASFEVFVYDRDTNTISQATSTPGGGGTAINYPMILPDGSKVCFRTAWNFFTNAPGDTFQIWEVDLATGVYRQVTSNPVSTPVFNPRMSSDGNYFTFTARINPTGQNADASEEVFRINRLTGATVQISNNAVQQAQFPDINADGSVIVWGDRANYDGTNTNAGLEIWKWTDGSPPTITAVTNQTSGVQETNLPKVDDAGRYVCFVSLFDFSGGAAAGRKIFLADTVAHTITRITSTGVGGTGADYPDAEIAPDGSAVFFESNINLGGQNTDGNRELWRYDVAATTLSAITHTTGGSSIVSLSDDATRRYLEVAHDTNTIAYRSEQDLDPHFTNTLANLDLFIGNIPLCPADVFADGIIDLTDFFKFLNDFDATAPDADIDGNPGVDLNDFFLFLNLFDAGC